MKPALWLGLALACGGALAVSWLPEDDLAAPVPRQTGALPRRATGAPTPPTANEAAVQAREAWPDVDTAARAAWSPPVKSQLPASVPSPPAPPVPPPPFPYQWLGQLQEGALLRFFLSSPQQTVAVAAGEVLEGRWRVDGAEAGRLRLTWLPTGATVHVSPRGPTSSKPDPA